MCRVRNAAYTTKPESRRDGTGWLNRMMVVFYCVVPSGLRGMGGKTLTGG